MSDDRIVISSGSALSPETVANRTFAASFRGYDQAEVRMFLKRVADELTAAAERETQLRQSLQEALARAAHPELDETVLTNALGEHTARLLTNARETAAAMVSDAEARAARMLQEGEGRIARMRAEAETLLARRAEEAERLAGGLRQAADSDARSIRDRARADAQAEIEAARAQGREMVAEAKELRERMLSDLLRRRRMAEAQIEQLRLAHQRLLEAYGVVRRTLDEATGELAAAEADTRPVFEAAMSRTERGVEGSSGVAEQGAHGSYRSPLAAPEFRPAPLPERQGRGTETRSDEEADDAVAAPGDEPAVAPEPLETQASTDVESTGRADTPPRPESVPVGSRSPGADHKGGLGALGGGTNPTVGPSSGGRSEATPPTPPGTPRPEERLAPVDLAAPGEEVRVVPGTDDPAPEAAARHQTEPGGGEAASNGGPGGRSRTRPSRRQRRGRTAAESSSGHVEELFARLRAAQERRDAAEGSPAPSASDAPADESPPPAAVDERPQTHAKDDAVPTAPSEGRGRHLADEKALYRRDELLDPIDTDLARRLKRVLQDEQNQVLDRLRRQRRPVAEATLPDLIDQTEHYRSVAAPLLLQAAERGASFMAEAVGATSTWSRDDESVDGWAADLAIELITPLRERLERAIQDAGADEDADATVGERLSASYRQWKLQHIEQVARHYSSAAFTRGAFAATTDDASLRWIVDDDGPCPDCEDNALAGPTPKGEAFPTGQVHPPAHPGCRCLLVPTVA